MGDLGTVVILAGGLSHEREVSLHSGHRMADALRRVGTEVSVRDLDATLVPTLRSSPPAAVLPVLHGASGEDGAVRDILDLAGIPYVGTPAHACRLAFDKPAAKAVAAVAGVATPDYVALPHETFRDLGAAAVLALIVDRLGLPLFVKPTRGGSALGASAVHRTEDLPSAMVRCFSYGDTALVERYVAGTEVAVSLIDTGGGPEPLPAVEIVPDSGVYDYTARYTAGRTEFFLPARLSDDVLADVARAAVTAHEALGLRDLSRIDLMIDTDGRPWFLEANVAPGMTDTSLFPQAAEAAGLDLGTLIRDLLMHAVGRAEGSPTA